MDLLPSAHCINNYDINTICTFITTFIFYFISIYFILLFTKISEDLSGLMEILKFRWMLL